MQASELGPLPPLHKRSVHPLITMLLSRSDRVDGGGASKSVGLYRPLRPQYELATVPLTVSSSRVGFARHELTLSSARLSFSSSDKTIKLWKVFEKSIKVVSENNLSTATSDGGFRSGPTASNTSLTSGNPGGVQQSLRLPRLTQHDSIVAAVPRKVYANAHAYHINSISINSDQETYISADDLRINLWNLNISDQSFSEYTFQSRVEVLGCARGQAAFRRDEAELTVAVPSSSTLCRHCGHQADQHGGADRGHHRCRVPPDTLQPVHVLVLKGNHQARRHARVRPLRLTRKAYVHTP